MPCEATRLMIATKHGSKEAFDDLQERLRKGAFHLAHSWVGSREDALELTQEAFLKVYKARSSFVESEPFLPWFHRILRNACFSFLRKQRRIQPHSLTRREPQTEDFQQDWELVDPSLSQPGEVLERADRAAQVRAALRRLSANDQEILSLRHDSELSYREIAQRLGVAEGTVMSRLFHARRRLKARLPRELLEEFHGPNQPGGAA
jgi:RNA polymerase sigma-70 factor (ECF subfamily)